MKQLIEELRDLKHHYENVKHTHSVASTYEAVRDHAVGQEMARRQDALSKQAGLFLERITALIQKYEGQVSTPSQCKHIHKPGDSCAANNNCTYPDCPTMSAEDFYNTIEPRPDFTELCSTGVRSNVEAACEFAEQYAAQVLTPSLTNEAGMSGRRLTAEEFLKEFKPALKEYHYSENGLNDEAALYLLDRYAAQVRDDEDALAIDEFCQIEDWMATLQRDEWGMYEVKNGVRVGGRSLVTYWRENVKGKTLLDDFGNEEAHDEERG